MQRRYLLFLLFVCCHLAWLSTSAGIVIIIPLKVPFPLKSLIAYGVFKVAKKTLFRGVYKIINPFGLRRTDQEGYQDMEALMRSSPHNRFTNFAPENQVIRITSRDEHSYNQMLQYLTADDSKGCLKRLVCNAHAATAVNADGLAEKLVIDLFGRMSPLHENLPTFEFHQAATIGHKGKSLELCKKYYSACPYSSKQLMNTYVKYYPVQSYPM